jgi:thiol-disulfide isomerase/thioredoxin
MQKSLMAVIAALVATAIILVSVGATRERHAAAANRPLQTSITAKTAKSQAEQSPKDASKDGAEDAADDDDASVIRLVRDPSPAPAFLLTDLDGKAISTAAYHGKVVLINFWATWCPPCREEIPEMIGLADKFKDHLQIIGVSMDDEATPSEVRDFARNAKMNYPIVMGSDKLSEEYGGIPALPTTFVLDTSGRVVQKHMGLYPEEVYDGEIRALLGMHVDEPVQTFVDTGQIFLKNVARATELPGVDFSGLAPGLKKIALKRLNSELCTCGCKMTIAQCRMNDPDCATSKALAARIIRQLKAEANAPGPTAQNR